MSTRLASPARAALESHEGATAVEYAIMVMLIALVIIAAVAAIGTTLNGILASVPAF